MSKYKIIFDNEAYTGKSYIYQGERYAILDDKNPKIYKSRKNAENAAKKLVQRCANISPEYQIIEYKEV